LDISQLEKLERDDRKGSEVALSLDWRTAREKGEKRGEAGVEVGESGPVMREEKEEGVTDGGVSRGEEWRGRVERCDAEGVKAAPPMRGEGDRKGELNDGRAVVSRARRQFWVGLARERQRGEWEMERATPV
jgi:hypothetical protein